MTTHDPHALVALILATPPVLALGAWYVRTSLTAGRRDDAGGAGLAAVALLALLGLVVALVVVPVLAELAGGVDAITGRTQ